MSPTPSLLAQADSKALATFVQKIRATRTQFLGLVVLGELRETLHMIRHPAEALTKGLGSYLSTLGKRTRNLAKVPYKLRNSTLKRILSDTWLEYSFGWRPLLYDVNTGLKALASLEAHPPGTPIYAKAALTSSHTNINGFNTGFMWFKTRNSHVETAAVIYRGYVENGPGPFSARLSEKLGFAPENWLPSVWELIPYSFLVDYFVNIDDIIACATVSTVGLKWMSRTTVQRVHHECYCTFDLPQFLFANSQKLLQYNFSTSAAPSIGGLDYIRISRAPYTGLLVPGFTLKTKFYPTQLVNAIALLKGGSNRESRRLAALTGH
jgi:hypothetical protein